MEEHGSFVSECSTSTENTMNIKTFLHGVIALMSLTASGMAESPEHTTKPENALTHYLDRVAQHNPTIRAARLKWRATKQEVPAAGALPDPELHYGYFFSEVETRVGPQNQRFGISQDIPWPARLDAERAAAGQSARQQYWQYKDTLREQLTAATRAWLEWVYAHQKQDLLQSQKAIVEQHRAAAEAAYASSDDKLTEILRVRQRLIEIEQQIAGAQGEIEAALAQLHRYQNQHQPPKVREHAFPSAKKLPPVSALLQRIRFRSEHLLATQSNIHREEERLRQARMRDRPDIEAGFTYTEVGENRFSNPPDSGEDALLATIRVSLPIWRDKYNAIKQSAHTRLRHARMTRREAMNNLKSSIRQLHAQATSAKRQYEIYRDRYLPESRDAYQSAQHAFTAGEMDYSELLETERALLDARLGKLYMKRQYLVTLTAIERQAARSFFPNPASLTHSKTNQKTTRNRKLKP